MLLVLLILVWGGGDQVRIFDDQGFLIDSVEYDDSDPWPLEPIRDKL